MNEPDPIYTCNDCGTTGPDGTISLIAIGRGEKLRLCSGCEAGRDLEFAAERGWG